MDRRHENEDRPPLPGAGYLEDYTAPFLVVAGVLCFIALFTIWTLFGLPVAVLVALLADRLITRNAA